MSSISIGDLAALVQGTCFTEELVKQVLERLESYKYTPKSTDLGTLAFSMRLVDTNIKNRCSISVVPEELLTCAVDRACGEVLFSLMQTGGLSNDFNLELAVKSVQTGDTNVSFATEKSLTQEQRLDTLIYSLRNSGEDDLKYYRKIRW